MSAPLRIGQGRHARRIDGPPIEGPDLAEALAIAHRFLELHPWLELDADDLAQEACLFVCAWSAAHGPPSARRARALMRSALWGHHARSAH